MRDQAPKFEEANCSVVGISFDTPADNLAFKTSGDFPFPLLSDADKSIGGSYEVLRDPTEKFADFPKRVSFLIDPEGVIVKIYDVTDPGGHAAEVLTDLAADQR